MSHPQPFDPGGPGRVGTARSSQRTADPSEHEPGEHPLSHGQEAIWFLEQLQPGGCAYNIAGAARFADGLDAAALRAACSRLCERHEALRTVFVRTPGGPVQRVSPRRQAPAPGFLEEGAEALSAAGLAARLAELAAEPFDLEHGPLLRLAILRLRGGASVLLLAIHHLVADLWSVGLLWQELSALYGRIPRGAEAAPERPDPEPPLPGQRYVDFVRGQRQRMAGAEGERLWHWWRDQLAGCSLTLDLPTDFPPPALQSLHGSSRTAHLSPALADRIEAFAAAERGTVYSVLLAAWSAVLAHWSGQDDLLVGSPTPGRSTPELAEVVGYFVNPLVVRADLGGRPSFAGLCRRLRRSAMAAFRHQDLPFPLLVERLAVERRALHDPSRPPVVQAMFSLQQAPRRLPPGLAAFALEVEGVRIDLAGLEGRSVPFPRRGAQFDVALLVAPVDSALVASLEYGSELFEEATAARLLDHFLTLLVAGLETPERPWRELPWFSERERAQLLGDWGCGAAMPACELCLHQPFELWAAAEPEAEALVFGTVRLSYRELDRRADRLARRLVALGVGPEVRVAVSLPRDLTLVVTLLAVLKAGGAYVPIDPAYPEERRALMLADSGARVLLSDRPAPAGAPPVASLDPAEVEEAAGSAAPPLAPAEPDALAYVLFTSGSTGRPKGVAISHRSAVAFIRWAGGQFSRDQLAGVLAATSISFDLSVFEIFAPLAQGGAVILAENALELPRLPAADRVTLVNTVPSAARELLHSAWPANARTLNLAGEALPGDLVRQLFAGTSIDTLWNLYGPTEDTTYSTAARIGRGDPGEPPIGKPIAGGRAYVVDREGRLVAAGVPGELRLGGAGLARGYLDRPRWTAERFVPDPFGPAAGGRLYRTGDLARFRPDGQLSYLGRIDQQVKVRGFRIELGEIEAALLAHPSVAEAAVLARGDAAGGRALTAYVVLRVGSETHDGELIAHLSRTLPAYMVPAAWQALPVLPLNANGKVDRRALAALAPAWTARAAFEAPSTPTQERLAAIWRELLSVETVGVQDNFFRLGGHSLLAARLGARIPEAFGVDLPLADLLRRPTLAALAERVDQLRAAGDAGTTPIPRADRSLPLPLSTSQQRLWLLDQLEPGSAVYNLAGGLRLRGTLAPAALAAALAEVIRRHEALRTVFPVVDGQPVQAVGGALPRLSVADLSALGDGVETELRRLGELEARRPFDLGRGPILRTRLLRLGVADHALLFCLHHIAADGWSLGVLRSELAALYAAARDGGPSPLAEPPLHFADFAAWQRERLTGPDLEAELALARERLAGAPTTLELPADRPRRSEGGGGRELAFAWDAETAQAVRRFAREHQATPFLVLLSAFAALLARTTGQRDLILGTAGAQRLRPELEGLIGFFANTLALRLDLGRCSSFEGLIEVGREAVHFALAHQELPFERLVEAIAPQRGLARSPLVQVVLVLQEDAQASRGTAIPGLTLDPLRFHTGTSKFDLTLDLTARDDGFAGAIEYRGDLFDASTVRRLERGLERLLTAALAAPHRPLGELPLLSPAERQQLVVEWNATATAFPREETIHGAFARAAAATPDAIAVVAGEAALSYAALDLLSRRLAAGLRGGGAGPGLGAETPIGIALERGLSMPIALLAILRSGGVYVPVDPGHPTDHVTAILDDAGVRRLLTEERFRERFEPWAARTGALLEVLDRHSEPAIEASPLAAAEPAAGAGQLAYVLFTSGSTGRPKGVEVSHRSVLRLVRETNYLSFEAGDVFLQLAPLAFDASTFEIWGPLLAGARLEIYPPATPTLDELAAFLEGRRITTLWLTAGLFHPMVDSHLGSLAGLTDLVAGGDVLSPPHAARAVEALATAGRRPGRLINGYGPTEGTTFTTCHPVDAGAGRRASVPIGRPIANTRVYLVDRELRPVPMGVAGELTLAGEGLARGYRGQPRATAERFLPDPFSQRPGARLYRSGDRARMLPDGNVEFLGRLDGQVKIRGFRIEPGEVEAALTAHPAVREAIVVVREDRPGEKRLVAYVVTDRETLAELRPFLRQRLPEYLVPADFVALDALPVNANGKVDRRALPAPEAATVEQGEAPEGATEEAIAALWCELLGRPAVGRHDDFFDLGGHSLLAARLATRLREGFGIELPLAALFEAPTLAELAGQVDDRRGGRLDPASSAEPLPLLARPAGQPFSAEPSFGQERLWFLDQLDPGQASHNLGAAFAVEGRLDRAALGRALDGITRRHEVLRTTFRASTGRPRQWIAPPATAAAAPVPLVDLCALAPGHRERQLDRLRRADLLRPFDLASGPLLRVAAVALEAERAVLLVAMHHVASDGWSIGILARELGAFYAGALEGRRPELPALPVQYADFAAWQRSRLSGEALEAEAAWWRGHLAGAPAVLALPTDRPRPAMPSPGGATWRFALGRERTAALEAFARRHGATPFMVLFAAFAALLGRLTGERDLVIGTPTAGRVRHEVEDLIGFFVNTLPLRLRLAGDPPFEQLVAATRAAELAALAHQEVPFAQLVDELAPARALGVTPLFQVLFVLQNAPSEPLTLPGLRLAPLPASAESVAFDLTVAFEEAEGDLHGLIDYRRELFDRSTAGRLAASFQSLLAAALGTESPLSRLPLLGAGERHQLVWEWNDRAADLGEETLPTLLARQAQRTPDLEAVAAEGETVTYRELAERAGRLARELRRRGVGPEVRVAVCVERSVAAVVGLLGVLEAGGAYLPLDPAYPTERLELMLRDSRVRLVLTQPWFEARFAERRGELLEDTVALALDTVLAPAAGERPGLPAGPPADPDHLAYVIYTSGSTGQPKGVLVPHRGLASLCLDLVQVWRLRPGSRHLTFNSLAFDASASNLYPVLISGATFVIHRDPSELTGADLERLVIAQRITHLDVPPAYWTLWLEELSAERCAALRPFLEQLNLGGDSAPLERVRRFAELTGRSVRLFGPYGPTETTVGSTYQLSIDGSEVPGGALRLPIGRPFANVDVHLLDEALEPVPIGVSGEIFIGGVGVTRGYHRRPSATAAAFVPHPLGEKPGARLYRTGDLARRLVDGTLEFLGRRDHQVKVRGFRIELGEIETRLRAHAAVTEAIVLARAAGAAGGDRQLVGYVAAAEPVAPEALQAFLAEGLPAYMVPAAIVVLAELPVGPTGKVDRQALPEPEPGARHASSAPPRGDLERALAALWTELLDGGEIGRDDDFFALGGHSLLATQVVSRVRSRWQVELPVRALFEAPTLARFAERIAAAERRPEALAAAPLEPAKRPGPGPWALPMSFAQQRLWFLDQLAPGSPLYNLPGAFRVEGELSVPAFVAAARAIVDRHEILRTTYVLADGEALQQVAPPGAAAALVVPLVDLAGLPKEPAERELRRLAVAEAAAPFDLAEGPVLRLRLLRRAADQWAVLTTLHHVASDGWSMAVFAGELAGLYRHALAGRPAELPPLPLQYADYAVWQRLTLAGESLAAELEHWRAKLDGAPVVLDLPTDRPRPAMQSSRGAAFAFELPAELSLGLREAARRSHATPYMVLLAAFQALVGRLTGRDDFLLGVGIANRNRTELEPLIGFFVNTLPVRARLAGDPRLSELLAAVREDAFDTFAHQEMPFDKLVDELDLPRDLMRMPLVQVAFVLQNLPPPPRDFGGAAVRPLGFEVTTAKFDLLLAMVESESGFSGVVEYATDLFDKATIARWCAAYRTLLAALATSPELRVQSVPLFVDQLAAAIGLDSTEVAALAPLTPTQRDLYLDHLLDPEGTVYSLGLSVPLAVPGGRVDAALWERAVAAVVAGEPALGVRFASLRGEPFQLLPAAPSEGPEEPLRLRLIDATEPGSPQDLAELVAREVKRPYDLGRGPLARHLLFRPRAGCDVAVLAVHHLVCDAFSGSLFFERVAAAYGALAAGATPPPAEDGDFLAWAAESSARFDRPETERFWRRRLAAVEVLDTGSGAERPAAAATLGSRLGGAELAAVREFCARHEVSAAALLRCLYAALLARLFDPAGDVLIHDVLSGRPSEHGETIGCFYQVLPAVFPRSLFGRGGRVDALLAFARDDRRRLGEHRNVSLLLQRQILRQGGIRFYFNYYHFTAVDLSGLGAGRGVLSVHDSFPRDEVHLIASDQGEALELALHFDPQAFAGLDLPARLVAFLTQVVAGVNELTALDLLRPGEREQVLAWNDTAVPQLLAAGDLCALLAEEALRSADRIALRYEDEALSYRQLHARAGLCAARLRRLGAGPEAQVGVFLERSVEMVVALLGVLRAGAAYLPLDPHHPAERLTFMLEDSGVRVVVSRESLRGALEAAGGGRCQVVALDAAEGPAEPLETLPAPPLDPDHPAYVIYTSGSTGRPKGAVNTHRALVNRLLWMQRAYPLDGSDAVLQKTPYTFDVSVWEFFWPLLVGARLVVARPEGHKDPDYLVETLRDQRITTLHFVPSMLGLFLEAAGLEELRSLRRVIASGEALPSELVRRFHSRLGTLGVELHNLYGPTEAAIDVTAWPCRTGEEGASIPIGRPIENLRTLVLDRDRRLVPPGVRGELYLGGAGLARGYHRRPALTAERFLPDPSSTLGGERLYRTGDLARQREDGALEYLGRIDDQVKIRGFRIELGEIEEALLRHPAVAAAVVVARADAGPTSLRLVAYLVPAAAEAPGVEELRRHLGRSLPDSMVPALFVMLERLPLSPNGKIDRRALPAPEAQRPDLERAYLAPRTELERAIAAVWQEALGVPRVGVEDGFFDLGGSSLQMARVLGALKVRLAPDLTMVELFQTPTVAALAALLEERGRQQGEGAPATRSSPSRPDRGLDARQRAALRQQATDRAPSRGREGLARRPR